MYRRVCVFFGAALAALAVQVEGESASGAQRFPFVISYDGPENASSMGHLLDAPAGKHGFVRVENGRFATDAGPIRFHGTNLTGPACFPSADAAEKLAARLARLGFNCVRLGNKGINLVEPRMIALQKEYARQLLTHVNPRTGNAYADEPCVAMIEISNENALDFGYVCGTLDEGTLPERQLADIQAKLDYVDIHAYWRHPEGDWMTVGVSNTQWSAGNGER